MTLGELAARLEELEHTRKVLEAELASLERTQQKAKELREDRDAALASLAASIPEALDGLTGEEINAMYRKLRLRVVPSEEGFDATGVLCTLRPTPGGRRDPRGLKSKAARLQTSGFREGLGRRFRAAPTMLASTAVTGHVHSSCARIEGVSPETRT